jgi:hypothetical protein
MLELIQLYKKTICFDDLWASHYEISMGDQGDKSMINGIQV